MVTSGVTPILQAKKTKSLNDFGTQHLERTLNESQPKADTECTGSLERLGKTTNCLSLGPSRLAQQGLRCVFEQAPLTEIPSLCCPFCAQDLASQKSLLGPEST